MKFTNINITILLIFNKNIIYICKIKGLNLCLIFNKNRYNNSIYINIH